MVNHICTKIDTVIISLVPLVYFISATLRYLFTNTFLWCENCHFSCKYLEEVSSDLRAEVTAEAAKYVTC